MKCVLCGHDMMGETLCSQCNTKTGNSSDKFNIEYKDFKVSEMLEIKLASSNYQKGSKGS